MYDKWVDVALMLGRWASYIQLGKYYVIKESILPISVVTTKIAHRYVIYFLSI